MSYLIPTGPTYYNVESYSAQRNSDMTDVWTNAILPAVTALPGIVYFPPTAGTDYWIVPPLVLPNRAGIMGAGKSASRLLLKSGANTHMVSNHQSTGASDAYGRFITIRDIWLDGNKANQTAGDGVFISTPSPGSALAVDDDADNHTYIDNVWIANVKQNGFANTGASEVRLHNVVVRAADGHGFAPNYDSWLTDCTAEWNGFNGFHIAFGSIGIDNCKAFYNGAITSSNEVGGHGLFSISAGSTGGVIINNFRAQDNGASGVYLEGGGGETGRHTTINGLLCDSNGWGHNGALATPGTFVGLKMFSVQYVTVNGFHSFDRAVDHGAGSRVTQLNAIDINASTAGASHNIYILSGIHAGMTSAQDASMGAAIKTFNATNVTKSSVMFNGVTTTNP